jgi:hypothetical protein
MHSYIYDQKPTELLSDLPPNGKLDFLRRYNSHVEEICKGRQVFTDTSPSRISDAWDIANLFPNSFFVFVKRSPIDTAVSIFRQYYNSGVTSAYDAETIRHYLAWYEDMQTVLTEQLGDRSIVVHHENFMSNPQEELTRIESMLGRQLRCQIPDDFTYKRSTMSDPFRDYFEAL